MRSTTVSSAVCVSGSTLTAMLAAERCSSSDGSFEGAATLLVTKTSKPSATSSPSRRVRANDSAALEGPCCSSATRMGAAHALRAAKKPIAPTAKTDSRRGTTVTAAG